MVAPIVGGRFPGVDGTGVAAEPFAPTMPKVDPARDGTPPGRKGLNPNAPRRRHVHHLVRTLERRRRHDCPARGRDEVDTR
ncbi:MAG TPA: hypothetical protein VFZ79_13345, partial [Acidimicrobiales bacterium]